MYYYIHRGIRGSALLVPTIFMLLWAIPDLSLAEILDDILSLVETVYNPSIYSLEGNSTITNYTLSSFLSNVVIKNGTFTINATQDDQSLQYYKTGFSWDSSDGQNFSSWEPLAITTWQDSIVGEVTEETISAVDHVVKGTVVVSWKDTAQDNNGGLRVTFVANGTGSNIQRRYKHVLLVENPTAKPDGGVEFNLINSTSIGGLFWHGNWLYVGDGNKGLRVFDTRHIWRVDSEVGKGMEYVIPQAWTYNVLDFPARWQTFTFDFLSLDRNSTSPCLLAGEYEEEDTAMTYLARWSFDPSNGRLKTVQTGGKSIATSVWAYRITILRARGIIFAHDAYYIGRLRKVGGTTIGDMNQRAGLYIWKPGTLVNPIEQALPRGAGGMAYSPNEDLMWTVGATGGARGVVGILAGGFLESQTSSSPGTNSTGAPLGNPGDSLNPSTPPQPHTRAIVGGVLGSFLMLALLAVSFIFWRRRRQADVAKEALCPPPGELPTHKPELDTSISDPAAGVPAREPVPVEMDPGQKSWAELEAVEKPVELPSRSDLIHKE